MVQGQQTKPKVQQIQTQQNSEPQKSQNEIKTNDESAEAFSKTNNEKEKVKLPKESAKSKDGVKLPKESGEISWIRGCQANPNYHHQDVIDQLKITRKFINGAIQLLIQKHTKCQPV